MRTQLAAVVSFEKMTLLALTFSRKTRFFAFVDYLFVLLQISIRNYVSAFLKKANTGLWMRYKLMKQCSFINTVLLAISMIVCYANFVFKNKDIVPPSWFRPTKTVKCKKVSMGWWVLCLTVKILANLRLTVNLSPWLSQKFFVYG